MNAPKNIVLIAGPNGAGKSTAAPFLLRDELHVMEFVNADTIAQGLSAYNAEAVALEAGRAMLARLHELASNGVDFAFETTLASRSFAPWIRTLTCEGAAFRIVFLWLPSPEMAFSRVVDRRRKGGHFIPEETVRRRYAAGLQNFFTLYRPLASSWRFYENTSKPRIIAEGSCSAIKVHDQPMWDSLESRYSRGA